MSETVYWDRWWSQDWSWEGLGKLDSNGMPLHPWFGHVVLADGTIEQKKSGDLSPFGNDLPEGVRHASLQDYWREFEPNENDEHLRCPLSGKRFTLLHLPLRFADGSPTVKSDYKTSELLEELSDAHTSNGGHPQWQGGVLTSGIIHAIVSNARHMCPTWDCSPDLEDAMFLSKVTAIRQDFHRTLDLSGAGTIERVHFLGFQFSKNVHQ